MTNEANIPKPYTINAFGQDITGRLHETVMLEGELTHIIHFNHPVTGEPLVTTRKASQ